MSESFLQKAFAQRIGGEKFGKDTKIYKFEKIKRAKREAQAKNPGMKLIDMGVGEPDDMAFPAVVKKLQEECKAPLSQLPEQPDRRFRNRRVLHQSR